MSHRLVTGNECRRQICSCGRAEVEFGCDLCAYCHREFDEQQTDHLVRHLALYGRLVPSLRTTDSRHRCAALPGLPVRGEA